MTAPVVTAIFTDLMAGTVKADLPLNSLSFSTVLNQASSFQATLNLTDPRVRAVDAEDIVASGKTAVYIDIDGDLYFGGILLTDSYDSSTQTVQLAGNDFWWYFANKRLITWSNAPSGKVPQLSYVNHDVLSVAEALINLAQTSTGGNIGVTVPAATSGQLVTVTYDPTQLMQVGQAIQTLAAQSGVVGFDFMIDVGYDSGGHPQKQLTLSAPRRGRAAPTSGVAFAHPGAGVVKYVWPNDATAAANEVYGIGAGVGSTPTGGGGPLRSTQSDPTQIAAGYPLLEEALNRSDVNSQSLLNLLTTSELDAVKVPVALPVITVSLDCPDPPLSSYDVGDDVRMMIAPDWRFSTGWDGWLRIVSRQITISDQGVSTVANTLDLPPAL